MMKMKFTEEALKEVETNYSELKDIASDMLDDYFKPVDETIKKLEKNVSNISVDTLKDTILNLSIQSYKISEIKDKSSIKFEIAEALRKEKYAIECTKSEGTKLDKDNRALLESSSQVVTEILYDLVSSLAKTKLDEIHRVVDSLKSILMTRMQEIKLNMGSDAYGGD